ncbi:N-acetylmuramoyl-L-alanine amidase [Thalassococcus sp. S3]|nr:N-acetylmuramoyl-L-alanine amidase [Thalassococcus sp. S3]
MKSANAALYRLCDPTSEVSAHYLIGADGRLWHLVSEEMRAWHAGAGSWAGRADVNSRSIGIELDNRGTHPFSDPQMRRLETLLSGVMTRWAIPPEGVIGHSDMAPDRKGDPGPRFDWARLARQGLAAEPVARPRTGDLPAFKALAVAVGYPGDLDDAALLHAVRLRFRPWAQGPLTQEDRAVLAGLLSSDI